MPIAPATAAVRPNTFKRRSRMTRGQSAARERLSPRYLLPTTGPLDAYDVFGRRAPLALEVGFGMGEATATLATAQPDVDVIAVDVHAAGVGHLMRLLDERDVTNVRLLEGDAVAVLTDRLPARSLSVVRVFFPDPWPKARHAKRRLVGRPFLDLVADRLQPGGIVHVATDCAAYGDAARAALREHPDLAPMHPAPWRPTTRFEQRALAAGRAVVDLAATRR